QLAAVVGWPQLPLAPGSWVVREPGQPPEPGPLAAVEGRLGVVAEQLVPSPAERRRPGPAVGRVAQGHRLFHAGHATRRPLRRARRPTRAGRWRRRTAPGASRPSAPAAAGR